MIASLRRDGTSWRAAGRAALPLWLILSLAACGTPPMNAAGSGGPFVLTARGDEVDVNAAPGVEVTLGAKRLRRAKQSAASE